jgi:hypothetical protein
MSRPTKTNPAYAALAYRKAIVQYVAENIKAQFIGVTGEPPNRLMCEEVFPVDAEVPVEDIQQYYAELGEEENRLDLELNKFEFMRKTDGEEQRSDARSAGSRRSRKHQKRAKSGTEKAN